MSKRRSGLHNDRRAFCYNYSTPKNIIPEIIITIQDNPTYTENSQMEFLRNVTIINGDLTIIMPNPDFTIFENLRIINGTITLTDIIDITGFNKLESCLYLYISNCNSISGFRNLTTITHLLSIRDNPMLQNLDGFSKIKTINNLEIQYNQSLTNISVLNITTTINDNLYIKNNASLTTISGFTNITKIVGDLYITDNESLTNISGFTNIIEIDQTLYITDNASLTTISGFTNIIEIGHGLYITNNASLTTISGFTDINTIGGDVTISDNNTNLEICKTIYDAIDAAKGLNTFTNTATININC
jgi:hypothetical protein